MSSIEKIYQDLKQMPPHLQNEVVDFIEFLRHRNNKNLVQQKTADTNTFFTDLMAWREKNQSLLTDESPWDSVRSKAVGREFSWED